MSLRDDLVRLFPELEALPCHAWVVGGAVRDLLLGKAPADVDITSDEPLTCAESLGRKVIRLGREHLSAWRVTGGAHVYDFAELLDHDIASDLARRDFTVNAMAVDLRSGELLDPHGGRTDLAAHVIRMIDEANFEDDPLRILKAARMAVTLDFTIEPATLSAAAARAERILSVAPERVTYELSVIFASGAFRRAVALLHDLHLDVPLFGRTFDATSFHADDVSLAGAFALLIEDPRHYAKRWRWSATLLREVQLLQKLVEHRGDPKIALYDAGEDVARQLPGVLRALGRDDRLEMPDFSIRPMLTGEEIVGLTGEAPGQRLGAIKRALLESQIRGEVNTRADAEQFVKSQRTTG